MREILSQLYHHCPGVPWTAYDVEEMKLPMLNIVAADGHQNSVQPEIYLASMMSNLADSQDLKVEEPLSNYLYA